MKYSGKHVELVRNHYDKLSHHYNRFWGDHIHHGYWENGESIKSAQVKLIQKLAEFSGIKPYTKVLDVGCGLGGSSLWLVKNYNCAVTGISISPVQIRFAGRKAKRQGLDKMVEFFVMDANYLDFPENHFDAIWIIECSEHLHDKGNFIKNCSRILKPGGILALCAWTVNENLNKANSEIILEICNAMLCPSLGSIEDYLKWMQESKFYDIGFENITDKVIKTWVYAGRIAKKSVVKALLALYDSSIKEFVNSFSVMHKAYIDGALGYTMFRAKKV